MTSSTQMPESHCHVRSFSMPSRSHPNNLKIEDALIKIKSFDSSLKAEHLSTRLNCLMELYNIIEDLLQLPLTQQILVENRQCVEDLLDGSVRVLDVCTSARDFLLQLGEQAQDLQTAFWRRSGGAVKEGKLSAYISFRKMMKKNVKKCLVDLKRMECKCEFAPLLYQSQHLQMVINILNEVNRVTISFFQFLMSSLNSLPKSGRWSFILKLKQNKVICDDGDLSESQCVDFALQCLSLSGKNSETETVEKAKEALELMGTNIKGLENGLEHLFKCLIQSRVSLLNILTQ